MFNPDKPELVLIKGGKDKAMLRDAWCASQIIEDSVIEEERVFSEGEIQGLIEQIAKKEGIKSDSLKITHEAHDARGQLVSLTVMVESGVASGRGWKNIEYDYYIKGKHGEAIGKHGDTCIVRTYNFSSNKDTAKEALVARYESGGWALSTGDAAIIAGSQV